MRLGSLIRERFAVEPTLVPGDRGVFDVFVNGKKLFSKHDDGQFPDEDELLETLAEL